MIKVVIILKYSILIFVTFLLVSTISISGNSLSQILGYDIVIVANTSYPGSMYPSIENGDAFVVVKLSPLKLEIGDLIVFINSTGQKVLHRLLGSETIGGKVYLYTKGDNYKTNFIPDDPISEENYVGKVIIPVPLYGHLILAFQSNMTRFLFLLILGIFSIFNFFDTTQFWEIRKNKKQEGDNFDLRDLPIYYRRSRYKIFYLMILVFLLATIIFPAVLVNTETGLNSKIDVGVPTLLISETPSGEINYYFVLLKLNITESSRVFQHIQSIEIEISDGTTKLGMMLYKPVHRMSGSYILGLGFYIPYSAITKNFIDLHITGTINLLLKELPFSQITPTIVN